MVARRMFSMRVRIGESGVSTALVSATSFLMSYEWSGVFQPEPVPHVISLPPGVSNGWQMSGGPARAGVAINNTAAATAEMNLFMSEPPDESDDSVAPMVRP